MLFLVEEPLNKEVSENIKHQSRRLLVLIYNGLEYFQDACRFEVLFVFKLIYHFEKCDIINRIKEVRLYNI